MPERKLDLGSRAWYRREELEQMGLTSASQQAIQPDICQRNKFISITQATLTLSFT
jgi:hypothetical protein